jgi:nitroreductase
MSESQQSSSGEPSGGSLVALKSVLASKISAETLHWSEFRGQQRVVVPAGNIEVALRAPTGANGQNWEFIIVKDPRVKKKLAKRYRQAWKLYYRTVIADVAAWDESMAKTARAVQWQVDHFEEIPVLVVACLRLTAREGRVPYLPMPHAALSGFFGSIYPSVQNLLLAARAMGLGASLITLPLWSLASARRALGLPLSITPCAIVPMGWPRGRYGSTTRRPVDEVVHLDTYGNRVWFGKVALTPGSGLMEIDGGD